MPYPNDGCIENVVSSSQTTGGCKGDIIITPCPPNPCPPICPTQPIDQTAVVDSTCPDRVSLPGAAKARTVTQWLQALADQFCTLNPMGIKRAKSCQVLTTVPDPNGGSMIEPRDVLDMLNCAPFKNAGEGFLYDGTKVTIAPIVTSIDKLIQLKDGPKTIVPGAFLVGTSSATWAWKAGCLPPCPVTSGLVLQSTANGGMQWGPVQPLGLSCKAVQKALCECLPKELTFPDRIVGLGAKNGDICDPIAASYSTCDVIRTGLKTCLTSKAGSPTEVVGFDSDGNAWKYKLTPSSPTPTPVDPNPTPTPTGLTLSCPNMKITFPSVATRATEVYGVGSDGNCSRFVRECDQNFRATARPAIDVVTRTRMISDWGTSSVYAAMAQDYNVGVCAGTYTQATNPGDVSFYTLSAAGRYVIEGSTWVNVKFTGSGPGIIHSDSVWAVISAIVITSPPSAAKEYRLGEVSNSIDYVTDPSGAYTVNNCTKGLVSVGMDFFFTRTLVLDLPAGATISVPRSRVNPVHNALDITAIVTMKTDGESSLAVTKLASPSF